MDKRIEFGFGLAFGVVSIVILADAWSGLPNEFKDSVLFIKDLVK